MIIIFVLGYIAIAFEHPLKIDKAASALAIGGLTWALFSFVNDQSLLEFKNFISDFGKDKGWHDFVKHEIHHHIIHISEILFFLLGAMTIVELIDAHEGFAIITDKIKTTKIFKWLKNNGISEKEMLRTFNCGVGFCLIIESKNLKKINKFFSKEYKPYIIGKISKGKNKVKLDGSINW